MSPDQEMGLTMTFLQAPFCSSIIKYMYVKYSVELDLQSLLGLHVHSCTHWLRPCNSPVPRSWAHIRGRYWSAMIDDISL